MKKIFIILFVLPGFMGAEAQTFAEWFQQKKTQISYLTQQISALQTYTQYLKQGYDAAQQGLNVISELKNGEFNLHQIFFSSLLKVNPAISSDARVIGIMNLAISILTAGSSLSQVPNLNPGDQAVIRQVISNMNLQCSNKLTELALLLTSESYSMTDDERIKRVSEIWQDLLDKYSFTRSFQYQTQMISAQRQTELNDIMMSKINNSIK